MEVPSGNLVSILIPAHNAQEWIGDCIRSALAQTWEHKEIIVVDDGSTDSTLSIARQFECDFVRVVTQQNSGAPAARNHALTLSRGDYIQWLDADDLLAPDKVEKQMVIALSEQGNRRILYCSEFGKFHRLWEETQFISTSLWCDLTPAEWLTRKLEHNLFMQTATWLTSRELTEAAGPWNTAMLYDDDGEYFCRVLLASEGVRFVPGSRVYYRCGNINSLGNVRARKEVREALWESMRLHIKYLRSLDDSSRVRNAAVVYLQRQMFYFYPDMPEITEQAQQLAIELGGKLQFPPELPRKFAWIIPLFGWNVAKRTCVAMRKFRWTSSWFLQRLFKSKLTKSWPISAAIDDSRGESN